MFLSRLGDRLVVLQVRSVTAVTLKLPSHPTPGDRGATAKCAGKSAPAQTLQVGPSPGSTLLNFATSRSLVVRLLTERKAQHGRDCPLFGRAAQMRFGVRAFKPFGQDCRETSVRAQSPGFSRYAIIYHPPV